MNKTFWLVLDMLKSYPGVWFDTRTVSLTLHMTLRTANRYKNKLLSMKLLLIRGRYFTLNLNKEYDYPKVSRSKFY